MNHVIFTQCSLREAGKKYVIFPKNNLEINVRQGKEKNITVISFSSGKKVGKKTLYIYKPFFLPWRSRG